MLCLFSGSNWPLSHLKSYEPVKDCSVGVGPPQGDCEVRGGHRGWGNCGAGWGRGRRGGGGKRGDTG